MPTDEFENISDICERNEYPRKTPGFKNIQQRDIHDLLDIVFYQKEVIRELLEKQPATAKPRT